MGTECRAFGLVPQERVIQVANLLRGMCYKYGSFEVHEVVLKVPLQGGQSSMSLKLSRRIGAEAGQAGKPLAERPPERSVGGGGAL